jgi:hypothetical protein
MLRRTPMKRGKGFKSKRHDAPAVPREDRPMALYPATRRGTYGGTVSGQAIDKDRPVRSEAYRRLVAAMPCADCGIPGPSQAAHANQGKGLSLKTDDRTCFPLCPRCHRLHDQGAVGSREMRRDHEAQWGAQTRAAIRAAGQWPASVPEWKEE